MSLYGRIIGVEGDGDKIPVHGFMATLAEYARGRLTGAQAQTIVNALSGSALSSSEVTEAQTLLATFTGTATAKLARAVEVDNVLMLAEHHAPGYSTPAEVATRLGV